MDSKTETRSDEEFYLRYRLDWMSDDQWECYQMLGDLYLGFHHVHGKLHEHGTGIALNTHHHQMATYDFSRLTEAVVMSHDRMIRFSIEPSGPGMLKLVLFKRHTRDGSMYERHPTMEDAIKSIRGASNAK